MYLVPPEAKQMMLDPLGLELQIAEWELGIKLGPLEEQPVLLTTKSSL